METVHMNCLLVFAFCIFTYTVLGKIEILPLPQEEQECFDRERVNGDLSRVLGHMVLEKCVYATEMIKMHVDTTKFPKSTVKWFQGLIEQSLPDSSDYSSPDVSSVQPNVKLYRGKRQTLTRASQIRPGVPQQQFGVPQGQTVGQQPQLGMPRFPPRQPVNRIQNQQQPVNQNQDQQPSIRIRKEYRMLSDYERADLHSAFQMLKADRSVLPNKFDALGYLHEQSVSRGHYGPNFFSWHRLFLLMVENALREKIPSVTIPYWDSSLDSALKDPRSSIIWTPAFLGYGYGYVVDGPFANWNTPNYGYLLRSFGQDGALFNWTSINSSLSTSHLANISFPDAAPENNLEDHHIQVHLWIGGFLAPPAMSAYDPVFYLLHSYVDLLWELFRNLQRRRGVDPSTDYPMDNNVTGHGYNDTAGLGNYFNYHGLSNHFTTNIYKYQVPPSCTHAQPSCGSRYIRCDTKREEPRCVSASIFDPFALFTPGGIPMHGSSGIRELRSTRFRKRQNRHLVQQNNVPAETVIAGSLDMNYANTFVLDGKKDPYRWAYVPVAVRYQHWQGESKAMVNDRCDTNSSSIKISIASDGFNYQGQYKHVQLVNTTNPEVTFTTFIGLKLPDDTKDTEVLLSAYDSCGRMCQPSCSQSKLNQVEHCSGALKVTVQRPFEYITHERKQVLGLMDHIEKQTLNNSDIFLSFNCNGAITDWIW